MFGPLSTSCGFSVVVIQQPTQKRASVNDTKRSCGFLQRRVGRELKCSITLPLMRSMLVVETRERLRDVIEMRQTKADEVIQALRLDPANPRLSERIRVGRRHWCLHDFDSGGRRTKEMISADVIGLAVQIGQPGEVQRQRRPNDRPSGVKYNCDINWAISIGSPPWSERAVIVACT